MKRFKRHSDGGGGAGGWGGDGHPMDQPQAQNDMQQEHFMEMPIRRDYTVEPEQAPVEYNWSMTGSHVSVSGEHGHDELFGAMNHTDDSRPHAWGTVQVSYRWEALWEIQASNMALHLVEQRLRSYSKDMGWKHVTIMDHEGVPFQNMKVASDPGVGDGNYPAKDWKGTDWYGDLGQKDVPSVMFSDPIDEKPPEGPMACGECGDWFPNYSEWRDHVDRFHINPLREPSIQPHPVIDLDNPFPADLNTNPGLKQYDQGRAVLHGAVEYIRQNFILAAGKSELVKGPIPFVFDIENDKVITGHPGERHADIKGQFTPGGVVEGLYTPAGKMQFQTDTDMPYTVRHMVQLWQSIHPELVVKSVEKLTNGKPYKLASSNIGHKVRNLALSDDAVRNVFQAVGDHGNVYVVGGAVRDAVLGKVPNDIDLMVQGIPMHDLEGMLRQLPGRVDVTGKSFGVLRYKSPDGSEVEVALPRKEQSTGAGHQDFDVHADPYMTADEDLHRRDFTANSMAVNLRGADLIDPFDGASDLKAGRLKTTWPGAFEEDPLRTVRALSMVSRHGLEPTPETKSEMAAHAPKLASLPAERIQMELDKIMGGDDPARAMQVAKDTGVLPHMLPELTPTLDFDQRNKYHRLPLDQHLFQVLHRTAELSSDKDLRLAALMHDVGKPGSFWQDDDGYGHYYQSEDGRGLNHEDLGAQITQSTMNRLKYPNARIDRVTHLVQHHMFAPFDTPKAARRRINQVGGDHIQDLLTLRDADGQGKGTSDWENKTPIDLQRQLAQNVINEGEATDVSGLVINGTDLISLGMQPGPTMGKVLKALSEKVIDDPALNNRHDLLGMAQEMMGQKVSNILDPVSESLDPEVFEQPSTHDAKLKPRIANWIKRFVYKTMVDAGWPDPNEYLKLALTGSLTTYQFGPQSDMDVSLWVDLDHFPELVRADLISLMIEHCDGTMVPGTTHSIQCFVVDTRKYKDFKDLYKPGLRSAWDIDHSRWIVYPERERSHDVEKEFPAAYAYAKIVADKMAMMLKYDPPMVKVVWDNLHRQRHRDMAAGMGDFAGSNIAYKLLFKLGMVPEIAEVTHEYIAAVSEETHERRRQDLVQKARDEGGFSVTKDLVDAPQSGYYVAYNGGKEIPAAELKPADIADTQAQIGPTEFIGAWLDNGVVYLDKSIRTDTPEEAHAFGHEQGQQAIWDANTQSVLPVLQPQRYSATVTEPSGPAEAPEWRSKTTPGGG